MRNPVRVLTDWLLIKRNPVAYARKIGVRIGSDCRLLNIHSKTFGSEPYLISIGNHVTVTHGVRFINHDGGMWVFRSQEPDLELFGPIEIGNNVFIGMGTLLLPNIRIGDNSVIGAGSVVTRSIPDNSVAVGVPAKVIKSVADYRTSLGDREFHIRRLGPDKKRVHLLEYFANRRPPSAGVAPEAIRKEVDRTPHV